MNSNFENIPEYLKEGIEKTIVSVSELREKQCLVFPIVTDLHSTGVTAPLADLTLKALNCVTKSVECDGVISLGDLLNVALGRNSHISNDEVKKLLAEIHNGITDNANSPYYAINGNHDGIGCDFFDKDLWNEAYKYTSDCVRESDSPYYYVDFAKVKTRCIFMSIPSGSDIDLEYPNSHWCAGVEQLKWLATKALNTEDDYKILLFSHTPPCYHTPETKLKLFDVWNGTEQKTSYLRDINGYVTDQLSIEGVLSAYQNHTKYSDDNVSCDFERYTNTEVCGFVCGHIHYDSYVMPGETNTSCGVTYTNGLPCLLVGCNGTGVSSEDVEYMAGTTVVREKGTASEISFDILVYIPEDRTIKFIRRGAEMTEAISSKYE